MIRRQWWHGEMEGNNLQELPSHNTPTAAPRCVSPQAAAMNTLPAPYSSGHRLIHKIFYLLKDF